jgi:parvulin-like peptidyl-prolyl isomerase
VKKIIILLYLIISLSSLYAYWEPDITDKDVIVATVNGIPITLSDVRAETAEDERYILDNYKGALQKQKLKKLRRRAADDIILRILISEKFDKMGYKVPPQLIEKMMDRIAGDLAGGDRKLLASKARQAGLTVKDLREQARKRVATMMLINARCYMNVFVTPKEVFEYYSRHPEEFTVPGNIRLQAIYLKSIGDDDDNIAHFALKLKSKLEGADEKTFSDFAAKYSMGPNRDKGGDLGWISLQKLRSEFKKSLKTLKTGEISGPVKTPEGFYFLRIKDIKEPETKSFNEVKKALEKKLEDIKKDHNYRLYVKKIRSKAIIRYFDDLPGDIGEAVRKFYSTGDSSEKSF